MGREQGTFKFAANLEIEKGAPLDSRMLVQNISDLTDSGATWNAKDGKKYLFNGLIVSVTEDNNLYMLIDAENYTDINSWKRVGSSTINLTHSELVELRDNSRLIPGCKYRITDYVTTTSQPNTQSAGHQFDLIVEALSENTISENAKAIHGNDGYFDEVNFNAWEIKYCLDNDASRFAWANTTNGKGVIYYMKDEWNNECPYDFKNIMFVYGYNEYTFSKMVNNGGTTDITVVNNNGNVCNNIILPSYDSSSGSMILSGNVFLLGTNTNFCKFNYIGYNSNSNTFGGNCYSNTLGDDCNNNYFGSGCDSNTFGDNCYSNRFGANCYSNTLGDDCNNNDFGANCYSNTFGSGCDSNRFGANCYSNTFGNYYSSNIFGNKCCSNSFGNNCNSNIFGNICCSNSFGNDCNYNGFYDNSSYSYNEDLDEYIGNGKKLNYVQYVTLNEGCHHLLFHTSEVTNEENKVQNITVTKGIKSIETNDGYFIPLSLEIPVTNNEYELKIARNINGDIKMYCEANLIK